MAIYGWGLMRKIKIPAQDKNTCTRTLAENVGRAYMRRGAYVQYAMVRYVSFNTAIKFACFEHKYHIKKKHMEDVRGGPRESCPRNQMP